MSAISNQNLVFCPPLLGKFSSAEDKPLNGPDTRSRVILKEQKGPLCGIRVLDLIREREKALNTVGTPTQEATPRRKFEEIVSERNKTVRSLSNLIPDLAHQIERGKVHTLIQGILKTYTKENINTAEVQEKLGILDNQPNVKVKIAFALPGFIAQNQYPNLLDYLTALPKTVEDRLNTANETFLAKAHEDTTDRLKCFKDTVVNKNFITATEYETFIKENRFIVVNAICEHVTAEHYGFTLSTWNPSHSHQSLMQELQQHGPITISGYFGVHRYLTEPVDQGRTIQGRRIYGWPGGAQSIESGPSHSILLVGAEKRGTQDVVYFIDPNDASDPNDPSKQRIYVMSYARLTNPSSIRDIFHLHLEGDSGALKICSPFGYGYYYNKPIAGSSSLPIQLSNLNIDEDKK